MYITRSAKDYQERRLTGDRNTRRRAGPLLDTGLHAVHSLELEPPLPLVEIVREAPQPPDAGLTQIWPWGGKEEVEHAENT